VRKSTSGISRNGRFDGSRCALLFAFLITSPFVPRGPSRADQPHEITVPLDEDHAQDPCCERLADDVGILREALVDDQRQRIGEDRRGFLEADPVLPCVSVGLLSVPDAPLWF
jgi:hypothetical protein